VLPIKLLELSEWINEYVTSFVMCDTTLLTSVAYHRLPCSRGLRPACLADALQLVARIPDRQHMRSLSTSALVYATVHCRRPSVSRRRGTNMEHFDRPKWRHQIPCKPSKAKTKISFILDVVPI